MNTCVLSFTEAIQQLEIWFFLVHSVMLVWITKYQYVNVRGFFFFLWSHLSFLLSFILNQKKEEENVGTSLWLKKNAYNDTSKQLTWFKCLIAP